MADVRGLGQALSQVTGQVLTGMREEKRRELAQGQIDATNSIVNSALEMDKKLSSTDETPFVRQRKVFEFISKSEREAGVSPGSALSPYKQFFGGAAGGGSSDLKVLKKHDWGITYWNPKTNEQTNVPINKEAMAYDDQNTRTKSYQKEIYSMLDRSGYIDKHGMAKVNELLADPIKAMGNPEYAGIVDSARKKIELGDKLIESEAKGKLAVSDKKNKLRKSDLGSDIFTFAKGLVNQAQTNSELTLPVLMGKLQAEVVGWSKGAPKEFDDVYGPLLDEVEVYIKNSHPSTQFDAKVHDISSRREYIEHSNNIILATAEQLILANTDSRNVAVMVKMMKGMNPKILSLLKVGAGTSGKAALRAVASAINGMGEVQTQKLIDDTKLNTVKGFVPKTEEPNKQDAETKQKPYNIDDDVSSQHLLGLIQQFFKPADSVSGSDVIISEAQITAIRADKQTMTRAIDTINTMLDSLVPISGNDPVIKKLIEYRTAIEGE